MSITLPRPNLLKPKIPSLFVIGLLASQYILFGTGSNSEPNCTLKVERPHLSTYLREYKNIDAVKLNITSECNVPQKRTDLNASIQTIYNNKQISAYSFDKVSAFPKGKNENRAIFDGLFATCIRGNPIMYLGSASGKVYLKSGQIYPVNGVSDLFIAVPCRISAK